MTSNPLVPDVEPAKALGAVVACIGAEVAGPLTSALDRVQTMAQSGRIDRGGVLALRDEIHRARRVGMRGQQIARLADGLVQQSPERLNLAQMLRDVLAEQAQQAPATGAIGNRQLLSTGVEVVADASLVTTVLRAAADWAVAHALAPIEWRLEMQPWPVQARMTCVVTHHPPDQAPPGGLVAGESRHDTGLDTLDWLLLRFAAHMGGISVQRDDGPVRCTLTLRFPNTVNDTLEGASSIDLGPAPRAASWVAGSQVLVLAAQRSTRQLVREAMQGHDLFIDHAPTVAAAVEYCREGVPQVLVFESGFDGPELRALLEQLENQSAPVTLLEIMPSGRVVSQGAIGRLGVTRIGADSLRQQLAPLLVMALAPQR